MHPESDCNLVIDCFFNFKIGFLKIISPIPILCNIYLRRREESREFKGDLIYSDINV